MKKRTGKFWYEFGVNFYTSMSQMRREKAAGGGCYRDRARSGARGVQIRVQPVPTRIQPGRSDGQALAPLRVTVATTVTVLAGRRPGPVLGRLGYASPRPHAWSAGLTLLLRQPKKAAGPTRVRARQLLETALPLIHVQLNLRSSGPLRLLLTWLHPAYSGSEYQDT